MKDQIIYGSHAFNLLIFVNIYAVKELERLVIYVHKKYTDFVNYIRIKEEMLNLWNLFMEHNLNIIGRHLEHCSKA